MEAPLPGTHGTSAQLMFPADSTQLQPPQPSREHQGYPARGGSCQPCFASCSGITGILHAVMQDGTAGGTDLPSLHAFLIPGQSPRRPQGIITPRDARCQAAAEIYHKASTKPQQGTHREHRDCFCDSWGTRGVAGRTGH